MKKAPLVLALSLVANVVLVGLYLTRTDAPAAVPPARPAVKPAASPAPAPGTGGTARPAATPAGQALNLTDAHELVAQMRAAGFPEETVAVAAQSRLMAQYYARYAEIMGLNAPVPPFWSSQASASGLVSDPARQAAQRELSREMTAAMKELLGPDYLNATMNEETRAALARQYGDLPAGKIVQLQQVMQDYSTLQSEIYGPSVGGFSVRLPEDTARLAQIEKDRRAAITALLTPAELEEYDLRSSNAAAQLRSQLIAFEPSEAEYRTLFKLQQAFDEKFPTSLMMGNGSQDVLRERSLAQQKLKEDMAAALPPDRAEAFLLASEPNASAVARIVGRLDMPMSTVGQVITIQKEIQAQASALRTDRTLPIEARNQALAALQQQANERIAARIGSNGLAAYKSSVGSWIQNLVPQPPAARGGAPAAPAGR